MDQTAQLTAALVFMTTTLFAFATAVIKGLVDRERRSEDRLDKTTESLGANTDAMAKLAEATQALALKLDATEERVASLATANAKQAAALERLTRLREKP